MHPTRLLLFGDQTVDKLGSIRRLFHLSKSCPTIRRFLRESADVVQREVFKLVPAQRNAFYGFDDLLALAEQNAAEESPNEVCATALMCIARIGELLLYEESNPGMLSSVDSSLHIIGFCTGLLPAAAALVSSNVTDLLMYGLEIVAISVRLGHEIFVRSQRVDETPGSWAYSIVGATALEVQQMLETFHEAQGTPLYKQAYVAVISRTWTTVFGPPSTLAELWQKCPALGLAPKLKLAANGAVHCAHLPPLDVERIIGKSGLLDSALPHYRHIISSGTCKPYDVSGLRGLLKLMLDDIMRNTLHLTDTVQQIVSGIHGCKEVDLLVVGPTAHTTLVQDALQSAQISVNVRRNAADPCTMPGKREGSHLVAIVGMSGRFPGGENLQEFWETLAEGRDLHEKIPPSRFAMETHVDMEGIKTNTTSTPYGCFVKNFGHFDTRMFNVSPREAAQMDPIQRALLMTTYEAMAMAGYSPGGSLSYDPKRIATYIGQATDDWRQNNECQGIDVYYIPGVARAFYPGRLNYHFKWEGGSYNLDSACASSSAAVSVACSALLSRECDTAIAGGGNLLSAPSIYAGLSRGSFLSKTGNCKPFRDDADGYCRGEGVGVVVLKRLEDALAENDNIQAVINGFGRNYSADAVSITQPYSPAQCKLYEQVLRKAGVDPLEIGYVEMHGTGTQAGDPAEVRSVEEVFCKGRTKENPLYIGAVKANIGHGEAAAGITSLIKAVLMLRECRIPRHPGAPFKVNHKLPALKQQYMKIAETEMAFESRSKRDDKRRIFLNNFDASGGNTCLIVEQFRHQHRKGHDPRSFHVVTCSGRTAYSLRENTHRLLHYIKSHPKSNIRDLAYTTTARRIQETFRRAYVVRTTEDLTDELTLDCARTPKTHGSEAQSSVVFVFTGQGSVYPAMGAQLFQTCSRFRETVLSYQRLCDSLGLPSVVALISNPDTSNTTKPAAIQSQLAIVVLELALADLWRSWGVRPGLLIGHSLGEYSALCISGVLSVSDTLYLVGSRSSILQQKCTPFTHAMLAVSASPHLIEQTCTPESLISCEISCKNAPNQTVISGMVKDLKRLEKSLAAADLKVKFLGVPYGFHSAQIEPILDDFERIATGIQFSKPKIPIASTLTGTVISDIGTFMPRYLVRQAREPVNFLGALQACIKDGIANEQSLWIEIGPDNLCSGMIRSSLSVQPTRILPSMKFKEDNWYTLSASLSSGHLAKLSINWKEYHAEYLDALTLLELPPYAFDTKNYWIPFKQDLMGPEIGRVSTAAVATPKEPARFLTTCLQYVINESIEVDSSSVTFVSYTSQPNLYKIIQGHLVDGVALCPASVFCDMAFTAAKYIYSKTSSDEPNPAMSLCSLDMVHPLVVNTLNPVQKIEVRVTKASGESFAMVSFSSSEEGSSHENGYCQVRFGKKDDWKTEFARNLHLVRKRADAIQSSALAGVGHRLLRPVIYRLFSSLVSYSESYQGLEEVFLDRGFRESTGHVRLQLNPDAGQFTCNPYWTDSLVHLAGFILNGDVTKPDDIAYIATGFDTLYMIKELSNKEQYTCYAIVQDAEDKKDNLFGDVYIFNGDNLVALCAGLRFQQMPKKTLAAILGKSSRVVAASTPGGTRVDVGSHAIKTPTTTVEGTEADKTVGSNVPRICNDEKGDASMVNALLGIIASESGFAAEDMTASTAFSDMGVDSLMSITVLSAAKHQLGMELPASFFMDNPTIRDLRQQLGAGTNNKEVISTSSSSSTSSSDIKGLASSDSHSSVNDGQEEVNTDNTEIDAFCLETSPPSPDIISEETTSENIRQEPTPTEVKAKLVLVQGHTSSKETPLFLATDGAGSATAYIHIPRFQSNRRIYALESPFLHSPNDFNCDVEDFCSLYVTAVRSCQPHGPYNIGGWSAGAVYAYEISRQLLNAGEKVQCLFLIDMRVPRPMSDALEPTMELIEQAGLVTGIKRSGQIMTKASTKLKQHLVSTVKALTRFQPQPMDPARRPVKSSIVWAARGISDENSASMKGVNKVELEEEIEGKNVMEDESTGLHGWFFAKRKFFGPNGWDEMVGEIECHTMDADHFSMVQQPQVKVLGKILRTAVEEAEAIST